ncbi:hypothetical protein BC938DRAFT_475786 [Jimgerdemannia flammicorona]|uniref:Uncharacterized protein n=1 Tax=Jimgerdemannia flammicorona TaxID=994334 RepID=A0A433PP12_9FUNG|nr:hypothetical protein BC938DRAFT_475786 [Jimgerdemannia flammicorona]
MPTTMPFSDLLTALSSAANDQTSVVILKRCGPYWLFCTDTEPQIKRFTFHEGQFVDSFNTQAELGTVFQTLRELVSPDGSAVCEHVHDIIDIERLEPKHRPEWPRFHQQDLGRLDPGQWLNDVIINEYMNWSV